MKRRWVVETWFLFFVNSYAVQKVHFSERPDNNAPDDVLQFVRLKPLIDLAVFVVAGAGYWLTCFIEYFQNVLILLLPLFPDGIVTIEAHSHASAAVINGHQDAVLGSYVTPLALSYAGHANFHWHFVKLCVTIVIATFLFYFAFRFESTRTDHLVETHFTSEAFS